MLAAALSSASARAGAELSRQTVSAGARLGRQNAEAAGIGIGVEHRLAFRQAGDEGAIVALVVIPAGLLALAQIGEIARAIFFHRDAAHLAFFGADIKLKPFQRARRRVVAQNDAAGRQHRFQRHLQRRQQRFHAGGGDLHHQRIAETVDGQARQAIAFGMHQAIKRLGIKRLAQRQRPLQPAREKSRIDRRAVFARQQAHRDQAFGIEIAGAEILAVIAFHMHQRAGRQRLGGRVHHDLVGENPGRAEAGLAAFARLDGDGGALAHGAGVSMPGSRNCARQSYQPS